jgi:uncharacterized protein (TIGR04255 family)
VGNQRQLTHPPLKEALIDIQLAEPLPLQFAESLETEMIKGLDRKQRISAGTFEFKIGEPQEIVEHGEELHGWRYESADGSRVAQVKRNGITYSILRNYKDWPEIRDATQSVWEFYLSQVGRPLIVARAAARYINVLEFPPSVELNDYLTAAPQIPKGLPQTVENFLQRVVIPYQGNIHAIITQALEATSQPGTRVILDIDVFAQQLTVQGESPDLWNLVDSFRSIKNTIFFTSVTETALEAYA